MAVKEITLNELIRETEQLPQIFSTKEFKSFIADKCLKELRDIQSYSLSNFDEENTDITRYQNNHKVEYGNDYLLIFNDTNLEQGEMWWVSEETREHYPEGISIAYIVEYGTGIMGTSQDDWQVDVNGHGDKGWVYKSADMNRYVWTKGIEGKFIYQKLLDRVKKYFGDWVSEYMERNW